MNRPPIGHDGPPELQEVLDPLTGSDCRRISHEMDEPMTAFELTEATGIPLSTTYRKLERLSGASLLEEATEIREAGHHTASYGLNFEAVQTDLTDLRTVEVSISRPALSPDEQLGQLWSELCKDT